MSENKIRVCTVCHKEYIAPFNRKYCPDCSLEIAKTKKLGRKYSEVTNKSHYTKDEMWEIVSCPQNSWADYSKLPAYQILESLRRGNFYPGTIIKDIGNNYYTVVGNINWDQNAIRPQKLEDIL